MNEVVIDAINWVGEQVFIEKWSDTTEKILQYDLPDTLVKMSKKLDELRNQTHDEAVEEVKKMIVNDMFDAIGIDSIEGLEKLLDGLDTESNGIEEQLQELGRIAGFEMIEAHELAELTVEEALVENALGTARENTEEEEAEEEEAEEEEAEEEEEEVEEEEVEEDEAEEEEHIHGPDCDHSHDEEFVEKEPIIVGDMNESIASFMVAEVPHLTEPSQITLSQEEYNELILKSKQKVNWEFVDKFWNEEVDLAEIAKPDTKTGENQVAKTLYEKMSALKEIGELETKHDFFDAVMLLFSCTPADVTKLEKLFSELE